LWYRFQALAQAGVRLQMPYLLVVGWLQMMQGLAGRPVLKAPGGGVH